jgi:hypothetical protein
MAHFKETSFERIVGISYPRKEVKHNIFLQSPIIPRKYSTPFASSIFTFCVLFEKFFPYPIGKGVTSSPLFPSCPMPNRTGGITTDEYGRVSINKSDEAKIGRGSFRG